MSKEQRLSAANGFSFTEREQLFDRISHERFLSILRDTKTHIHNLNLSTNTYGEFLFVTASRPNTESWEWITFWGLGLHERRERYLLDEWFWYKAHPTEKLRCIWIDPDSALAHIQIRREEIEPDAKILKQSKQGLLFEMLADLTDDDGASMDMDNGRVWWEE